MSKALLVGINYKGTSSELRGCINDIKKTKEMLLSKGYSVTMISEEQEIKPTKMNILKHLEELIKSPSERLYFHYSGHGTQIFDVSGDEDDGKDECLVPLDYSSAGVITDDHIKSLLKMVRRDQTLFSVLDCCHSGTGMDLKYNLYTKGRHLKMVPSKKEEETEGQCIMLSGCLDIQTSADAYIKGEFQGAMTFAFLEALPEAKDLKDLIQRIRDILRYSGYPQIPTLSMGKKMKLHSPILI